MPKLFLAFGSASAFLSVLLGAFGAHILRDQLSEKSMSAYSTGTEYQMAHSLALILLAILFNADKNSGRYGSAKSGAGDKFLNFSGYAFISGIILFSGSLYGLSISGLSYLGAITPLGGTAFLLGWGSLFVYALSTASISE